MGHSAFALLLTKVEPPMSITPRLFEQAFLRGSNAWDLLFDKGVVGDGNWKPLVLAAARAGEEALDVLFKKCEIPPGLPNDMIESMTLGEPRAAERLYLGRWKDEFEISELMTKRLVQGPAAMISIFLRSKTSKLQITEAVLRQASSMSYSYYHLLHRRCSEVDVSEAEAIKAIKDWLEALRRCLDKPGTNFQVTEAIFKAAMLSGTEVAEMLFRKRESEVNIWQEVREIYQLREDLCNHVLKVLDRTEHTVMLREALARYGKLDTLEAIAKTTDVVRWQGSPGVCVSRWRKAHDLFKELTAGSDIIDMDEARFQGQVDGDFNVKRWLNLDRYGVEFYILSDVEFGTYRRFLSF